MNVAPLEVLDTWSDWGSLGDSWATAPREPGLYRLRRDDFDGVDYIGQTGAGIRRRLSHLRGAFSAEMPYSDPHTAGPGIWALRQGHGGDFLASSAPTSADTPVRRALECVAISLYRQETRESPTLNFGRIPAGYTKSVRNKSL